MFRQQGKEPLESKVIQMLICLTSSRRWGLQTHIFLSIKIVK